MCVCVSSAEETRGLLEHSETTERPEDWSWGTLGREGQVGQNDWPLKLNFEWRVTKRF